MTNEPTGPDDARRDAVRDARTLLRGARAGTLATIDGATPFASLVTPATAPDGSVLLLLSELSEHTRHLHADGRCSLLVTGQPAGINPQTTPRLTVTGVASMEPDAALKARWVTLHPYAGFYAGFADFSLWRLRVEGGLFIGGFASAHRLDAADLAVDPAAMAAVADAEPGIVAHCNDDHPDALDVIAADHGLDRNGWRMAACDCDGFDLVRDQVVRRVPWPSPVDGPGAVRAALVHLAGAARQRAVTQAGRGAAGPV